MAHSYVCLYVHSVFSTKNRKKIISPDLEARLWPYMGGIARENNMKALAIGGVEDHSHVFLSLPSTITVAKAIQLIKGGSSKWVSDTFPSHRDFEWQEGYGAFSVSVSLVEDTIAPARALVLFSGVVAVDLQRPGGSIIANNRSKMSIGRF